MAHNDGYTRVVHGKPQYVHSYDDKRSPGISKMRDVIGKMLKTKDGISKLSDQVKSGGFKHSIPEVTALHGIEQGKHHPYPDAFDHTIQVLRHLPENVSDMVKWAALLHDIGKATTRQEHPKHGVVFHGHERESGRKVWKVLERLGFNKEESEKIFYLVRNHGSLRTNLLRKTDKEAQEFASHKHFSDLLTLHEADVRASNRDPQEVLDKVASLKNIKKSFRYIVFT